MKADTKNRCSSEESRKRLLQAVACAEELLLRRLERVKEDEARIDALLALTDEAASAEGLLFLASETTRLKANRLITDKKEMSHISIPIYEPIARITVHTAR